MKFSSLLRKIDESSFSHQPFKHISIDNFFEPEHFEQIVASKQIALDRFKTDEALIKGIQAEGYKSIPFPGTTQNIKHYLFWHKTKSNWHTNLDICEGFGITFRLMKYEEHSLIKELNDFFNTKEFLNCIANKFDVPLDKTYADNGLQKYLDGYEISPHPDIRRKALTYMINVNPAPDSEKLNYHTHYLKFKPSKEYIQKYWEYNKQNDRCWVPWDWCETVSMQKKNNSIVMFSPSFDTMHAVKASYNHLLTQRTQFYGNLWFNKENVENKSSWADFVISCTKEKTASPYTFGAKLKSKIPFKKQIKKILS